MSVVKTRSVSPSTPSHSVFALISLTGSKHNPVVLQKSKGSICQETSSPSPHGNRDGGASLLLEPHQKSTPGIWMECREVWGGSWILWGLVQLSQGFFLCTQLVLAARTCCTCQPVNKRVLPHCWEQENPHCAWVLLRKHVLKGRRARIAI